MGTMKISDTTEIFYVTYVQESTDEAESLARYLTSHGIEAVSTEDKNEVVIPMTDPTQLHFVYQLRRNWVHYWCNYEAALFSLPVYVKR